MARATAMVNSAEVFQCFTRASLTVVWASAGSASTSSINRFVCMFGLWTTIHTAVEAATATCGRPTRAMIGGATAIMHEMSIAGSMLEAVRAESARHNAHVLAVGVKIGELSGLDAESLRFCFDALVQDTETERFGDRKSTRLNFSHLGTS